MPEDKKMAIDGDHNNSKAAANKGAGGGTALAQVTMLDGSVLDIAIDRKAKGRELLDRVCEAVNLIEKNFGLTYADRHDPRNWLDLEKRISKFMKAEPWKMNFEVKFYPPDPAQLQEDITHYHLCLQIRNDILSNRLPCSFVTHALLGSYLVQSELGDYDPDTMGKNYLKDFKFAPNQTPDLEEKVMELHRTQVCQCTYLGSVASFKKSDLLLFRFEEISVTEYIITAETFIKFAWYNWRTRFQT
nr:unnamed protein product [Callosobruchus chinensis]